MKEYLEESKTVNHIKRENGSFYTYLPEGCRLCSRGSKLVVFVTGICPNSCFYCPTTPEKKGDMVYVNERLVKSWEDIIDEAETMDAEGASLTGGDPIEKIEKSIEIIKMLKDHFGTDFHVHLYTSIPVDREVIEKLYRNGMDEIRFHPPGLLTPERYEKSIRAALQTGVEVGFEVPTIKFNRTLVEIANRYEIFINLNQVEFTPTNFKALSEMGFTTEDFGAVESDHLAQRYGNVVKKFHYCTASFKDGVQFRNRLMRMARKMSDMYYKTDDGTVLCGFIEGEISKIVNILKLNNIPHVVIYEQGVEVSLNTIKKLGKKLKRKGFKVSVIERYPTSTRTVVEVIPV